jgi:hypothetical protein
MMKQEKNLMPLYFPVITGKQTAHDETLRKTRPSLQKDGKPPEEGPLARTRGKPMKRFAEIIDSNNSSMTNDCQYPDFSFSPIYILFILFILFLCQKKENRKL